MPAGAPVSFLPSASSPPAAVPPAPDIARDEADGAAGAAHVVGQGGEQSLCLFAQADEPCLATGVQDFSARVPETRRQRPSTLK